MRYHLDMLHSLTGIGHGKKEHVSNINLIFSSESNNHRGVTKQDLLLLVKPLLSFTVKDLQLDSSHLNSTLKLCQIKTSIQKFKKVGTRSRGRTKVELRGEVIDHPRTDSVRLLGNKRDVIILRFLASCSLMSLYFQFHMPHRNVTGLDFRGMQSDAISPVKRTIKYILNQSIFNIYASCCSGHIRMSNYD